MKINDFADSADAVCDVMALLSNRHRLMILCFLLDGEKSVRRLATLLDVREAVVSQHLAILRRERIVKATREGQTMRYRLIRQDIVKLLATLSDLYCGQAAPI